MWLLSVEESARTGIRSPRIHIWFQADRSVQPIITLGLFPLKIQASISEATVSGATMWRAQRCLLGYDRNDSEVCGFPSLRSAITGGPWNTSCLPFESFHQHQPTSLQVQDPFSASVLPWRGSSMQVSPPVPPSTWGTSAWGQQVEGTWGNDKNK